MPSRQRNTRTRKKLNKKAKNKNDSETTKAETEETKKMVAKIIVRGFPPQQPDKEQQEEEDCQPLKDLYVLLSNLMCLYQYDPLRAF